MASEDRGGADLGTEAARRAGDVESLATGRPHASGRVVRVTDRQPLDLEERVDRGVRRHADDHDPTVSVASTQPPTAARLPAMAKITIIGAGSVEFTRNILADLCAYEELHGTLELALHDIDAGASRVRASAPRARSSSARTPATRSRAHAARRAGVRRRRLPDQRDPGRRVPRDA